MSFDPIHCRMARTALSLSSADLAGAANVGVNTVSRFEMGQDVRVSSLQAMKKALEARGAVFLEAGQVAPCECVGVKPPTG